MLDPSIGNPVQYFSRGSKSDGLRSSDGVGPGRPTDTPIGTISIHKSSLEIVLVHCP